MCKHASVGLKLMIFFFISFNVNILLLSLYNFRLETSLCHSLDTKKEKIYEEGGFVGQKQEKVTKLQDIIFTRVTRTLIYKQLDIVEQLLYVSAEIFCVSSY